jgi:hypothetical protein
MLGQILSAGLQIAGPLYDAYKSNQADGDASNLDANMQPYQNTIDFLNKTAQERMTPGSAYNMQQDRLLQNQAYDTLGLQNMLAGRGTQMGGMGGYSGIQDQQARADLSRAEANMLQQLAMSRQQRETQGLNLLGNVGEMQRYVGEQRTQRDISQPQMGLGGILGMAGAGFFNRRFNDNLFGTPGDIEQVIEEKR